jgi:hypothetical protein
VTVKHAVAGAELAATMGSILNPEETTESDGKEQRDNKQREIETNVLPVAFKRLPRSVGEFAFAVHLAIEPLALIATRQMRREVLTERRARAGKREGKGTYIAMRTGNGVMESKRETEGTDRRSVVKITRHKGRKK